MGSPSNLSSITNMIVRGINAEESGSAVSDNFYMLEMLPFTKDPIEKEASKLLYVAGQKLGQQSVGVNDDKIKNLANVLGIREIRLFKKKKAISAIRLRYKPTNSVSEYIDLSTSLVAGMMKGIYNNAPHVVKRVTPDMSYTVDLIM